MRRNCLALLLILLATPAQALDWKATERTEYYMVDGATGMALYRSIGEKGPKLSTGTRTIAVTDWSLKWGRDYVREGSACRLKAVRPFLEITYKLPKPRAKLTGDTKRKWDTFVAGMAAHEKVHGELLHTMTEEVIRDTLGFTMENDPKCRTIRDAVKRLALDAYARYRTASRDFDRAEMAEGGNVHRLVFGLVR